MIELHDVFFTQIYEIPQKSNLGRDFWLLVPFGKGQITSWIVKTEPTSTSECE